MAISTFLQKIWFKICNNYVVKYALCFWLHWWKLGKSLMWITGYWTRNLQRYGPGQVFEVGRVKAWVVSIFCQWVLDRIAVGWLHVELPSRRNCRICRSERLVFRDLRVFQVAKAGNGMGRGLILSTLSLWTDSIPMSGGLACHHQWRRTCCGRCLGLACPWELPQRVSRTHILLAGAHSCQP